jgi:uncharacterized protein YndB with AHSA1/START domain
MTAGNTVRLHRVFAAKPEKVYRAFVEADAMSKWISPDGFTCTVHHHEPKVGGTYRMSFRNFDSWTTRLTAVIHIDANKSGYRG